MEIGESKKSGEEATAPAVAPKGTADGNPNRRNIDMAERRRLVVRAFLFSGINEHEIAIDVLRPIARLLRTKDPADSVNRVFILKHVNDLRLICAVSLVSLVWIICFAFINGLLCTKDSFTTDAHGFGLFVDSIKAFGGPFLKLVTPSLAVFGTILAWAYQAGSTRLGVVDLFACEIDTLCRMVTVNDSVTRQIQQYAKGPQTAVSVGANTATSTSRFSSEENYFPVFDGNVRDLQTLEARVVVNITAFYTYMKAVRDSLRALALISPTPEDSLHWDWKALARQFTISWSSNPSKRSVKLSS